MNKEKILKNIDEMIAEMKKRIDPNPLPAKELYYGKGYIDACEVIKELIEKIEIDKREEIKKDMRTKPNLGEQLADIIRSITEGKYDILEKIEKIDHKIEELEEKLEN